MLIVLAVCVGLVLVIVAILVVVYIISVKSASSQAAWASDRRTLMMHQVDVNHELYGYM